DYIHVNLDTLKTKSKCFKAVEEALESGKSVIIDNTNPSAAARLEFTEIAKEKGEFCFSCTPTSLCRRQSISVCIFTALSFLLISFPFTGSCTHRLNLHCRCSLSLLCD